MCSKFIFSRNMYGNFKLNSGFEIPLVGFGTFQIQGGDLIEKVLNIALGAGYRHIDTAVVYRNEAQIGSALKKLLPQYNLKREDIFITSKLIPAVNKGSDHIINLVKTSISNLQTDYIDLYLIHWPGVSGLPVSHPDNLKYRRETWKILVKLRDEGLIRSIGVSNYTVKHLKEMLSDEELPKPAVNQVEWHPHFHNTELLDFCRKEKIFLQAYSSLGTSNYSSLRTDPTVVKTAERNSKSSAQILLNWALQQNVGIIPKAQSKDHIVENFKLDFELSSDDMKLLDNMQVKEKYAWNPDSVV